MNQGMSNYIIKRIACLMSACHMQETLVDFNVIVCNGFRETIVNNGNQK